MDPSEGSFRIFASERHSSGTFYMAGTVQGTVDFEDGPDTVMVDIPSGEAFFLCKLDSLGNVLWVKDFAHSGTISQSYFPEMAIDFDVSGNLVLSGRYKIDSADFDPGPAQTMLYSPENHFSMFLTKFTENGDLIWARGIESMDYNNSTDLDFGDVAVDTAGNIYLVGALRYSYDFDPGPGQYILEATSWEDIFIAKYNSNGDLVWAKITGSNFNDAYAKEVEVDNSGNVYVSGKFYDGMDADPGPDTDYISVQGSSGQYAYSAFLIKLDNDGLYQWGIPVIGGYANNGDVESMMISSTGLIYMAGGVGWDCYMTKYSANGNAQGIHHFQAANPGQLLNSYDLDEDELGDVYLTGTMYDTVDFSLGAGTGILTGKGVFICKFNSGASLSWASNLPHVWYPRCAPSIHVDDSQNVYCFAGLSSNGVPDLDPSPNSHVFDGQGTFLAKYNQRWLSGYVYNDLNGNCNWNENEHTLANWLGEINPGGLIVQTNAIGEWEVDSLPSGNYTITFDSVANWVAPCSNTISFNVVNSEQQVVVENHAVLAENACPSQQVSVFIPAVRPCFEDQPIHIEACNLSTGTLALTDPYVDLYLGDKATLTWASTSYTIVNNSGLYRLFIDQTLYPEQCVQLWGRVDYDCDITVGETLCATATLFPQDSCIFDTIPASPPADFNPCQLPWDQSSVSVDGWCENDSLFFTISNIGLGNMTCFSPVRLFIDTDYMWLDSIQLNSGITDTLMFAGDGKTWRLEVDQHPLHPGNSNPSTTLELCGPQQNWTPGLVTAFPMDDADPFVATYCEQAVAAYDPNDKLGIPTGVGPEHFVAPNQKVDYRIRFQNTGNDTAFTVVIRDTLDPSLDVFTVTPGIASHDYEFEIYGPRVMQWTFNNILLPDSTTDLDGSQGFLWFSVDQMADLPDGTEFRNDADIYFDFNEPIYTNNTSHVINRMLSHPTWEDTSSIVIEDCAPFYVNGVRYEESGDFWQLINGPVADTLLVLSLELTTTNTEVVQNGQTFFAQSENGTFQWLDCLNGYEPIEGAISAQFTPKTEGAYAVLVTEPECADTSDCFVVLGTEVKAYEEFNSVSIYPNPSSGIVTVQLGTTPDNMELNLYNSTGALIDRILLTDQSTMSFELPESKGIYLLQVIFDEFISHHSLIKIDP